MRKIAPNILLAIVLMLVLTACGVNTGTWGDEGVADASADVLAGTVTLYENPTQDGEHVYVLFATKEGETANADLSPYMAEGTINKNGRFRIELPTPDADAPLTTICTTSDGRTLDVTLVTEFVFTSNKNNSQPKTFPGDAKWFGHELHTSRNQATNYARIHVPEATTFNGSCKTRIGPDFGEMNLNLKPGWNIIASNYGPDGTTSTVVDSIHRNTFWLMTRTFELNYDNL